jgi:hypothetical protein
MGVIAPRRTDPESRYVSDELHIPYSTGMLGSFSAYRAASLSRDLTCFECQAAQHYYGTECPSVGRRPPDGRWTRRAGT